MQKSAGGLRLLIRPCEVLISLSVRPELVEGFPLPARLRQAQPERKSHTSSGRINKFKELNRGKTANDTVSAKGRKAPSEQLEDAHLSAVANARLNDGAKPIKLRMEDL